MTDLPPDTAAELLTAARPDAEPPPEPEALAPLFPHLAIEALIGRGAMGAVYRVRQRSLDRVAALKLFPGRATDEAFAQRVAREVAAQARLDHPLIVRVLDHGRAGDHLWLLLQHVDGANLRQALHTGRFGAGPTLVLMRHLCDALAHAHAAGVVHRDLKPENILLDAAGTPHLADFGLAKLADAGSALTGSGAVLGTVHYMAPEQIEAPQHVDARADLYALGVILHELLTGRLPLGRHEPPSQTAGTPKRLDAVVARALARDPARRWQSADAFAVALGAPPSSQHRRRWSWAIAATLLAALGLALWPYSQEHLASAATITKAEREQVRRQLRDSLNYQLGDICTEAIFAARDRLGGKPRLALTSIDSWIAELESDEARVKLNRDMQEKRTEIVAALVGTRLADICDSSDPASFRLHLRFDVEQPGKRGRLSWGYRLNAINSATLCAPDGIITWTWPHPQQQEKPTRPIAKPDLVRMRRTVVDPGIRDALDQLLSFEAASTRPDGKWRILIQKSRAWGVPVDDPRHGICAAIDDQVRSGLIAAGNIQVIDQLPEDMDEQDETYAIGYTIDQRRDGTWTIIDLSLNTADRTQTVLQVWNWDYRESQGDNTFPPPEFPLFHRSLGPTFRQVTERFYAEHGRAARLRIAAPGFTILRQPVSIDPTTTLAESAITEFRNRISESRYDLDILPDTAAEADADLVLTTTKIIDGEGANESVEMLLRRPSDPTPLWRWTSTP